MVISSKLNKSAKDLLNCEARFWDISNEKLQSVLIGVSSQHVKTGETPNGFSLH
jgi:hypothetical protein